MRSVVCLTLLLFAPLLFLSELRAQACGHYRITVTVQDQKGKAVKNATVALEAVTIDESKGMQFTRDKADPASFTATFFEGTSFKEFHRVVVTAPKFERAENLIKPLSCENKNIVVKLAPAGSDDADIWEFEDRVVLQISAPDGKSINDAELTVTRDDQPKVSKTLKYGYVDLTLPAGKYVFHISADGYLKKEMEVDLTAIANTYLKIQMMPEGNAP